MQRYVAVLLGLILLAGRGLAAEPAVHAGVMSSTAATVAHYSYPPPTPPSTLPIWWQKTAKFICYWAEAVGAGVAGLVGHPYAAPGK